MRTVSAVAAMTGVTVRTLHHYDEIGLLRPRGRTDSGYRLYDRDDLQRLQQILVWRALGFPLAEIQALLDDPGSDRLAALIDQRAELVRRLDELGGVLKAVDAAIDEESGGPEVDEVAMFDEFSTGEYADEAEARWGDTDAWTRSRERMAHLTDADKRRVVAEGLDHVRRLAEAFTDGVASDSPQAMDLAEEARLAIDRQFYDCSRAMHVNLAEMYVSDPRFTAYYDQHADGLAAWFHDAIVANAAR